MAVVIGRYVLAAGLVSLAASIIFLAFEVSEVRRALPGLMTQLERTATSVRPVAQEIETVTRTVPAVLAEVRATRETIPGILAEIEASRAVIAAAVDEAARARETTPLILQETAAIRAVVPQLLSEVAAARATVDAAVVETAAVRAALPAMLESVDSSARSVADLTAEAQLWRPVVADAVAESRLVRESIDPTLTRVDQLIEKADITGKKITETAVTRAVTGVITSPFRVFGSLIGSTGDREVTGTMGFARGDIAALSRAFQQIDLDRIGSSESWRNPETGMEGTLSLVSRSEQGGQSCRVIRNYARNAEKVISDKNITVCRNDAGKWELNKS